MSSTTTGSLIHINSADEFESSVRGKTHVVLFFKANWHRPCQQLTEVIHELAKENPVLTCLAIEAESLPNISEKYSIQSVPTIILITKGAESARMEASQIPDVVSNIQKFAASAGSSAGIAFGNVPGGEEDLNARIGRLINSAPVMVFMKGNPENPRCKFSRQLVNIFSEQNVTYSTFDILGDNDVRQGIKTYSNWPTFPQLYVNGKLIGGLDIVKELIDDDEFQGILPKVESLEDRMRSLINSSRVMLFMKGNPSEPRCGFSAKIVEVLRENKCTDFHSFDILTDNDIRQGLKTFSNWPTFPQLYVNGELVGGLDIVREMAEEGDLQAVLSGGTQK